MNSGDSEKYGVVKTSHDLADRAGQDILRRGGNAVDAAVAVGFVLAVVHPVAGGIGGGGFAVVRLDEERQGALDFRDRAPFRASRDMYLGPHGEVIPEMSLIGHRAAAVPGCVAGLCALRDRFGSLPLGMLMAPAITLAREGFIISPQQELTLVSESRYFSRFAGSRRYFLKPGGLPYRSGDRLVQEDLAKTLELIAENGAAAFYTGAVAEHILRDMADNQGLLEAEDLAAYQPRWREPLRGTYRDCEIITPGPPAGGLQVIQMLHTLEQADLRTLGPGSSRSIHLLAEAMRYAFADRAEYLGDPEFTAVPVDRLTSKAYGEEIYGAIRKSPNRAVPSEKVRPGLGPVKGGAHTTHYSVVDGRGGAAALTYTINDWYGSRVAVPGAGFLLNNSMDDFAAKPGAPNLFDLVGGEANSIAGGKRPLSCMSPALLLKEGKFFLALGSPGGSRIISTVLQVIVNVVDHGMTIAGAVAFPRVHHQWQPDELRYEPGGLDPDTARELADMGYALTEKSPMGDVNAVLADPVTGALSGAGDPRRHHWSAYRDSPPDTPEPPAS
jgi:gamma-glutamyltranspeptidase/glutathione hydrolase